MPTVLLRIRLFLCVAYLIQPNILQPICADAFPSLAHPNRKQEREERAKYRDAIHKAVQDLQDLPYESDREIVKDRVVKVRDAINAFNTRYDHPELTRGVFKCQLERILLMKRAKEKDWDKSRHALRRYSREICYMMFPDHPKSQKYKTSASLSDEDLKEIHDKFCIGVGPALARDLGWCCAGVALTRCPNPNLRILGWAMIANGAQGAYNSTFNTLYTAVRDYQQIPATHDEIEYLRGLYEDKQLQKEPLYNMQVE